MAIHNAAHVTVVASTVFVFSLTTTVIPNQVQDRAQVRLSPAFSEVQFLLSIT